jgi:hypothetical protein
MLIHIGYHKAASTWLQQRLFAHPATGFRVPWSFDEVIDHLVRPHPLAWDVAAARARLAAPRPGDTVTVISNEELSGNPHAGGLLSTTIARRLAEVFPDARILIVIRRQVDMLVSTYKQYVRRGGVLPPRRYFEPPAAYFRMPTYRPTHHEYHRLIARYHDLFGADRVLVVPVEHLAGNPRAFVSRIVEHAGARDPGILPDEVMRASLSALTTSMQRVLNRWLQRDDVNPAGLVRLGRLPGMMVGIDRGLRPLSGPFDARLRRYVEGYARGRFRESNRRTTNLTGLDLDALGYEV